MKKLLLTLFLMTGLSLSAQSFTFDCSFAEIEFDRVQNLPFSVPGASTTHFNVFFTISELEVDATYSVNFDLPSDVVVPPIIPSNGQHQVYVEVPSGIVTATLELFRYDHKIDETIVDFRPSSN